jgi:hypothetical protein
MNKFTKRILEEEIQLNYPGTMIDIVSKMVNVKLNSNSTIESVGVRVTERIKEINSIKQRTKNDNSQKISEIRRLLDKSDIISRSKLFELIKH